MEFHHKLLLKCESENCDGKVQINKYDQYETDQEQRSLTICQKCQNRLKIYFAEDFETYCDKCGSKTQ